MERIRSAGTCSCNRIDVLVSTAGKIDDHRSLAGISLAAFIANAIAWADSRAGIMPSHSESVLKASIASSSETDV